MRALIATLLLVFGCIVCTVDAVGIYTHGSIPTLATSAVDGVGVFSTVSPEAAAQGLRVGDRYRYEENWPVLRATDGWGTRGALPPNVDVPVTIERDGRSDRDSPSYGGGDACAARGDVAGCRVQIPGHADRRVARCART